MNIYTKTGDKGTTSTLSGERVSKSSSIINLNGDIDEVNSSIGFICSLISNDMQIQHAKKKDLIETLHWIQNGLYNMGIEISSNFTKFEFNESHVLELESKINELSEKMPIQKAFLIYSGSLSGTFSQFARSIVRRCERTFVSYLIEKQINDTPSSYLFMNRLSDYLFTLSRYLNFVGGAEEIKTTKWQ